MSDWNKFQNIINKRRQKKLHQGIQEVESTYQDEKGKEEGKEEAIKEATQRTIEEMNLHPEMALEFLKLIEKSEELPKKIVVDTIKNIPNTEKISDPERTLIEAVKNSSTLNSGDIKEIIKESDISLSTARKVAEQIPNKEIRETEQERLKRIEEQRKEKEKKEAESRINLELKELYVNCDEIEELNLIDRLNELKEQSEMPKTIDKIVQILSRKAAIEWRQFGTVMISAVGRVIPPEELLERKFQKLVGEEFESIKDVKKYKKSKEYEYNEEDLQNLILQEIAKKVAKTYNEVEIIDVPQSEAMKNISEKQEEEFIKQVQTYGDNIDNTQKIKNQIRGKLDFQIEDLEELLKKLPEKEREEYVNDFKRQLIQAIKENQKDKNNKKEEQVREIVKTQIDEDVR